MIIIKHIILYFIQIRHTDDFPSTGTRLVHIIVLKPTFRKYPVTHTNYITHCTTLQYYMTRYLGGEKILNTKKIMNSTVLPSFKFGV